MRARHATRRPTRALPSTNYRDAQYSTLRGALRQVGGAMADGGAMKATKCARELLLELQRSYWLPPFAVRRWRARSCDAR